MKKIFFETFLFLITTTICIFATSVYFDMFVSREIPMGFIVCLGIAWFMMCVTYVMYIILTIKRLTKKQ